MTKKSPEKKLLTGQVKTAGLLVLPARFAYTIVFAFCFALYGNTLWNTYAIDDTAVYTDNVYTKKGLEGLKDIFTHDAFEGYFGETGAKILSGGRYRPLSIATFAIEYEITRKIKGDKREHITNQNIIIGLDDPYLSPGLSHFINVLLFAITCCLLYYFLLMILPSRGANIFSSIAFIATLLFAAHPIHTEVVANIKGRDEIMSLLFSLLAVVCALIFLYRNKYVYLCLGALCFFFGLLSKENAITFLAIVPLTYFFFTNAKVKDYGVSIGVYVLPVVAALLLRSAFTHQTIAQDSNEILDNPFLFATVTQRYATIGYTFLRYYRLLLFPHPLTHDYFFNQIPYVDLGDLGFLIGLVITISLLAFALANIKGKAVAAYAILFYFITFSIVSNVLFTVGALMNERFIYMSSLGFCLLLAIGLIKLKDRLKITTTAFFSIVTVTLSLYSFKTITRNMDWANDPTLIKNDTKWSPNSAKIQASLANELTIEADKEQDLVKKNTLLDSAIVHINEALRIYPARANNWVILGNAVYRKNHRTEEAIPIYEKAATGDIYPAFYALAIMYNNAGNAQKAKENLTKAFAVDQSKSDCAFLMAQLSAELNQEDSVKLWLKYLSTLRAVTAQDYYLIGLNWGKVGNNLPKSIEYLKKSVEMRPEADLYQYDLGVAYTFSYKWDEAIETFQKLIKLNPNYANAYKNLAIIYQNKKDTVLSNQYMQKYNEVYALLNK